MAHAAPRSSSVISNMGNVSQPERPKPKSISKQAKAGLTFAVARVDKKLRQGKVAKQVSATSGIAITAVVEHVILKIVESAGAHAEQQKSKRLTNSHVVAAVRSDPDLARTFAGFCFTTAEDVPKAIEKILPEDEQKARKAAKRSAAEPDAAQQADPAQD